MPLLCAADHLHGMLRASDHRSSDIHLCKVEARLLDRLPLLQAARSASLMGPHLESFVQVPLTDFGTSVTKSVVLICSSVS